MRTAKPSINAQKSYVATRLRRRYYVTLQKIAVIPAATRSQALVWGRSLVGIVGSNPAWGMDVCFLCVMNVVR
jgi:hypothetical protein